jgi:hypothetical protein
MHGKWQARPNSQSGRPNQAGRKLSRCSLGGSGGSFNGGHGANKVGAGGTSLSSGSNVFLDFRQLSDLSLRLRRRMVTSDFDAPADGVTSPSGAKSSR